MAMNNPNSRVQGIFESLIGVMRDAKATQLKVEIDNKLKEQNAVGDMSPNDLYDLMDKAAATNTALQENDIERDIVVRAVSDDMVQKTAAKVVTILRLPPTPELIEAVKVNIDQAKHDDYATTHINDMLGEMAMAAVDTPQVREANPNFKGLDETTKGAIVADVVADLRERVSITVANDLITPPGTAPGGYPSRSTSPR